MATWNETIHKFSSVTDKLGKEIDRGIFETVVALNLLGVSTIASCEGHLNWGVPYPWIDIEATIEQKYLLHQYLARFYEGRQANFDSILMFHGYRMRSAGGAFSPLLSPEEQEQKLKEYQAEMTEFTAFMKSLLPDCD
ncbi:MAG TPA: hypothetical protein VGF67_16245 [Ktedonobacteraceae bacterium]|jgi:hypothetical protein